MKVKKIILGATALILSLGAFSGCGNGKTADTNKKSGSSDKTTINFTWWGSQERADTTNEAVKMFMKENPDIEVKTSFYPFDSYWQNLNISATSNNLADVFQAYVGESNSNALIAKGKVQPFDKYIKDGTIKVDDISENVLKICKYQGETYGMPFGVNAKIMYLDPDLYEKAGVEIPELGYASYDDLEKDLVKIKAVTGKYGMDDPFSKNSTLPYWIRQHGEVQYTDKGDNVIGFSEKTYTDFYNKRLDWVKKGLVPPYDVSQGRAGLEDAEIVKGNSGAITGYTNEYGILAKAAGKSLTPILLPGPDTDKGLDLRVSTYAFLANTKDEKRMNASAKLVNFLINNVEANKVMNADRGMFASNAVREKLLPELDEYLQVSAKAVEMATEHATPSDPFPERSSVEAEEKLGEMDDQIMSGAITPKEAYKQIIEVGAE